MTALIACQCLPYTRIMTLSKTPPLWAPARRQKVDQWSRKKPEDPNRVKARLRIHESGTTQVKLDKRLLEEVDRRQKQRIPCEHIRPYGRDHRKKPIQNII